MSSLSEPRRPRLLARSRKLRHLKGLSLRNLSFAPAVFHTADDAALDSSPGKLGVVREPEQLQTSRSSDSLRTRLDPKRPPLQIRQQPRRTTSLTLAHATPASRQRRLEALVDASVGDAFFSLHVAPDAEPVYISEMRQRSANFNFHFFDLASHGPSVSRSSSVTVRVWARRPSQTAWVFVLEALVDLGQLNFIGTLVDRRFPPNALIFHLEDGLYSLDFPSQALEPKQATPAASSSYNALMKLVNMESSVQDALETQHKIVEQINTILEQSPPSAADAAQQEVALAQKYVATQRRANGLAETRRDELCASLSCRRAAMTRGRDAQAGAEADMADNQQRLEASRQLVEETERQIRGQRRRICSELSDIFPIAPIADGPPLSFRICNLPLPNSTYDAATARAINEDVLSAALGLVALLTRHLQLYLSRPLPYPLYAYGSRSVARDDISHLPDKPPPRREFPLFLPRGGSTIGQWRFEYGWFLLNKDIEALCASQGLRVVDIRHSLPNLKYLLYVCSAGSHDVPERKRGGVRGLWAGKLRGRLTAVPALDGESSSSAAGSRPGSADAAGTPRGDVVGVDGDGNHDGNDNGHGYGLGHKRNGNGNKRKLSPGGSEDWALGLPFGDGEAKFTLRTKGLRENVAGPR